MKPTLAKILQEAERCYQDLRLIESYNLFRRFFDRIPFQVEKEHTKYIGMFIRLLLDLGKESQLSFYLSEIEKKYTQLRSPELSYQLAVIFMVQGNTNESIARLEETIRDTLDNELKIKAKMCLMHIYETATPPNIASCRALLSSIGETSDPDMQKLLLIWKANLSRLEKDYLGAEKTLSDLLSTEGITKQWYIYFSARMVLGWTYLDQANASKAREVVDELRGMFSKYQFKTLVARIVELEEAIAQSDKFEQVRFKDLGTTGEISYKTKQLQLDTKSSTDQVIKLLVKDSFVSISHLSKLLNFDGLPEKKRSQSIQAKLSSARKRIQKLGLSSSAIKLDGDGYRFIPDVAKETNQ